ncbi:MAG TPA: hypothetical protein VIL74_17810 [Pyrinomonadaceae bacterium]|jgi:hypothetical protein
MKKIQNPDGIELKPKPTNWNFKDLEGERFGRLYVAGYLGKRFMNSNTYWLLHCDCGNYVRATTQQLTGKKLMSCGCLKWIEKKLAQNKEN